MSFAGAIFDLDGTLVDTSRDITASVNHVRAAFGLEPISLAEAMRYIGDGLHLLMQRVVVPAGEKLARAVETYRAHHAEHFKDKAALYEGATDALGRLEGAGIKMAVVSNKPHRFALALLEHLDVAQHFTHVLGEETQPAKKPAPDGLLFVLKEWDLEPARAVMVGDSHQDVESGRAAGCRTIWCSYGFGEPRAAKPDFTAGSMREVAEIVLE